MNQKMSIPDSPKSSITEPNFVTSEPVPNTKLCPVCGEEIKKTAKKCIFCGEFIAEHIRGVKLCPVCGEEVKKTAKKCIHRDEFITEYTSDVKLCSVCGEEIKATAKKCNHCNEFFEEYTHGGWRWPVWTGFRRKSLWDWLSLWIVPIFLALGGFL